MNENKTGGLLERLSAAKTNEERDAVVSNISVDSDTELSLDELGSVSGGGDWLDDTANSIGEVAGEFFQAYIYYCKHNKHMSVEDIIEKHRSGSKDGIIDPIVEQGIRDFYNRV